MASRKIVASWDPASAPTGLHVLLRTLGEHYPIVEGSREGAIRLQFDKTAEKGLCQVDIARGVATVRYDEPCRAARAVGSILSGAVGQSRKLSERIAFETFGIMIECSRNAVMTVDRAKSWLRQLALLGYNMAMLYTEDTYELPGEEYFGYLRGRYTAGELTELDAYAAKLGIELIACIQTLGHLEQILRWPAYGSVRDTSSVLLVDNEPTYQLIEKMIAHYAKCFASRRIHIGQDEAHDLGRGKFLDRFGYERAADIFNRHLAKVVEICRKHGLSPMIWSDMYFRMSDVDGEYYNPKTVIPEDVKNKIPPEATLVYWDYYHPEKAFYLDWIARHRALGGEPVMASGVWTWKMMWYDRYNTEANARPCVVASREAGVKDFLFTTWGDDGAYCELDSAFAGLVYGAELAYVGDDVSPERIAKRYAAICGGDYELTRVASDLNKPSVDVLWDDPLLGILWKDLKLRDADAWTKARDGYASLAAALRPRKAKTSPVDYGHAFALADMMLAKVQLKLDLDHAYESREQGAIRAVCGQVPALIRKIDKVLATFRRQWYSRNKPQGFEVIQLRLGGLKQRYVELSQRLGELLDGKVSSIPELDEKPSAPGAYGRHHSVASGSVIL